MSASPLVLFNKKMDHLFDFLMKKYPTNRDLKLSYEKFKMAKQYDPRKILENFFQYAYPYKSKIMERDERFFLEEDIKNHIKPEMNNSMQEYGITEDYIINKALDIKQYWGNMSEEDKNHIWNDFQTLIKLTEEYIKRMMY